MDIKLYLGDCLEQMKQIPDGSVDMICTDLPYGVLSRSNEAVKWDCLIPFEPMWEQFLRISKSNAAIVLFSQGMFTAQLMMSQPKLWRYNLVWLKCRCSGHLNANRMPLRAHEDICIFYREQPTYNPQKRVCSDEERTHLRSTKPRKNSIYGKFKDLPVTLSNLKFPTSILIFPKPAPTETVHPTQKPVDLLRWLIRTYTNEGETVFDATMGSGSTGVASVIERRNFIGIEKEEKYFKIASERISSEDKKPHQEELFQ